VEISRGADSLFVRAAVDAFGCSCVSYQRGVLVRHLEIVTIPDYYRKRLIYGRSSQHCRKIGGARALNTRERLRVFRKMAQKEGYGILGIGAGMFLLGAGVCCFSFGRLLGIFERSG
jgi:hypothetical protein